MQAKGTVFKLSLIHICVEASGVTFLDRVRHAILPALTLSITGVSNIALHTREKMIDICLLYTSKIHFGDFQYGSDTYPDGALSWREPGI